MLCVEVRGGVVVAVYSSEISEVIIVDQDNNEAGYLPIDPISTIPDNTQILLSNLQQKNSDGYRNLELCN